jgi:hypothetical protein
MITPVLSGIIHASNAKLKTVSKSALFFGLILLFGAYEKVGLPN